MGGLLSSCHERRSALARKVGGARPRTKPPVAPRRPVAWNWAHSTSSR
jgi:hypothetical protein